MPIPPFDEHIFEAMPGNSLLVAPDAPRFSILAATSGMIERSGLLKEQLLSKPFFEPFPVNGGNAADQNAMVQVQILESFAYVIKHRKTHEMPLVRYDLADSSGNFKELYWKISNKPVVDNNGSLLYIIHTSVDVTAPVLAERREQQLNDIEKQHRVFMQAPLAMLILKGDDLVIELANQASLEILHKDVEVIGKPLSDVLPELREQGHILNLQKVLTTGTVYEAYEHPLELNVQGQIQKKLFNIVSQPYYETYHERPAGVLSFLTDVTEKVAYKQALRESNERFEAAIDAIDGILWTNNFEGKMVGEQKGWAHLTGQSYEEYQGFGWSDCIHPDDVDTTVTLWKEAVKERKPFVDQHRLRMKNGEWGTFAVRSLPLFDGAGNIREWVGVHTNISDQQRIQQNLRESEARFRKLADDSPIFVFSIDPGPDAHVNHWNKTWLTYTGQTLEDARGRAWNGIIHVDDIPAVMDAYTPAYLSQTSYLIPAVRVKRYDGVYRWHAFKGNPRYSPEGIFEGYVGVGFDIDEQKQTEEKIVRSEERTRLAVEAARLGTFEIDTKNQTMIYSARAAEIFGLDTTRQWPYTIFIDAIHPEDIAIRDEAHKKAKQTGELAYETRIIRQDGEIRSVRLNAFYINKDHSGLLVGTIIDITDEKRTSEILEQKINERTKELQQANEQLTQFAYSASHDLQEPLRKIHFLLDRLLSSLGTSLTDHQRTLANRIQQTTGRMRLLIDDLLAYSNTSFGVPSFETVDLDEVVQGVVDDMEASIALKNGIVKSDSLIPVRGDRHQLRQLFQNLISNSIKYHRKDIAPVVTITRKFIRGNDVNIQFSNQQDDLTYLVVEIKDNGIGFEPADAQKIFNVFQRLHGRGEYEGTGIGLAIVQKVVENHKGYVAAESQVGQGSIFRVFLPLSN